MADTRYVLTGPTRDRIMRAVRKVETLRGPGVSNTPEGIVIDGASVDAGGSVGAIGWFFARISGYSQYGSNHQWTYTFVQIYKALTGYGGWSDFENGHSGTAYNLIEDQNTASGPWGNGVSEANMTGTFDIQPCPSGTRVVIYIVPVADGTIEYWFSYENGVDGTC